MILLAQRWRNWWRSRLTQASALDIRNARWIPIRELSARHRQRIARHLLELGPEDRYLRFGYPASDEQIERYVEQLNFDRDEIFGVFNRRLDVVAMAHLAYSLDPQLSSCAEFGVSVAARQRGKGMGGRLFQRAVQHARNDGVSLLFIHALSENAPMLKIARGAGATVERDGSESEAYLRLPVATLDSRLTELMDDKMADLDYRIKQQARQFRQWLSVVQEVRQGIRKAHDQSRP